MEVTILEELFQKISEVTTVEDIGYHRIEEGRLKPFYKTQTDILGIEKWKTVHGQNPVYVKDTFILREITTKKQPIEIYDTKNDTRSADAFFLFGIDSIMIIPVVREDEVKAIICIASIGKYHQFTKEEMETCSKLADDYLKNQY
ncbi:GAF domain-containing protein [Anaerocolumna sp. AGMB13020]|uniref:GAF domain-containing protein n=1 Tax=Anaerocolumna sp. AGMB13020 TaxID=3081750 RepID=UPI002954DDDB|nr:GAF domain-containing protein [Anaerocolumna sp. AGMB13020]WOO38959.1 GAF domain-containing protein [Anaerocolumna sp. AGMB13020]